MISNCCKAPVKVVGGSEGTNHYECIKCHESCDVMGDRNMVPVVVPMIELLENKIGDFIAQGMSDEQLDRWVTLWFRLYEKNHIHQ